MTQTKAYAVTGAESPLAPWTFERRELRPHDVKIEILYCGVCHSDIHQARNEWGGSIYPMVPGHEIVGRVTEVGAHVKHFKVGDLAGVGCLVDSCRTCASCKEGLEQYCEVEFVGTYNGHEVGTGKVTYGGYSSQIVVDEHYTLHVSDKLSLAGVAPLLCAGITTWSPLKEWNVGAGHKLAVLGLGGLGHMAVKLGRALGADVTMLSGSAGKQKDAERLGAHHFILTSDEAAVKNAAGTFDFILDTVSAPHDYNTYLNLLKRDGTMMLVGVPPVPTPVAAFPLVVKRRRLVGSLIGGIRETQEMLDFCAQHNIVSDVEVIAMKDVNAAYERVMKGDVRYRFVIDMKTL